MSSFQRDTVSVLLGEPRRAVRILSIPIAFSLLIQTLYNIVDGIWVSGIPEYGDDALAAVGVFFPVFMILMAFASGIGIGGGAAISRKIGEKKSGDAGGAAVLTYLLTGAILTLLILGILPVFRPIMVGIAGCETIGEMAYRYGRILLLGSPFLAFTIISNAILKAEGDAKRSMLLMSAASLINIGADPLFIYTFDLGYTGAAWATVFSFACAAALSGYWLWIRQDTHITFTVKTETPKSTIIGDILRVGIPTALAQTAISVAAAGIMRLITLVGDGAHLAAYTSCWRVLMFINIPAFGLAGATLSVIGAAYGEENPAKMKSAYFYAIQTGLKIQGVLALCVFLFAEHIALIFSYADDSAHLRPLIATILRYLSPVFAFSPMGIITSAMFRSIKRGGRSLVASLLRTVILQLFFHGSLPYTFPTVLREYGLALPWEIFWQS
ncbi:MATE efflux family protein [Chitinivibrio alkaliphilus ACht1]|uniref:MATE efflux family protein n=2 Tax=Chitinivibrio TaxID=1505231 RepID=U7DAI0_9BACT|nr:MATE efflux family protein [Chitinivibrio alkaliphilus ACht1]